MLLQLVILGWLAMADILQNPFGFNPDYDINLTEVSSDFQRIVSPGAGGEYLASLGDPAAAGEPGSRRGGRRAPGQALGDHRPGGPRGPGA
jgi:hypothetical protein